MKTNRKRGGPRVSLTLHEATADAISSIGGVLTGWSQADLARFLLQEGAYALEDYIIQRRAEGWTDKTLRHYHFTGMAFRFDVSGVDRRRAVAREDDHARSAEAIETLLAAVV
jgi:hypothetical protein